MLQGKVIGIYCLIDDIFKGIDHPAHRQRKISDSEVITAVMVSPLYLKGNKHCAITDISYTFSLETDKLFAIVITFEAVENSFEAKNVKTKAAQ